MVSVSSFYISGHLPQLFHLLTSAVFLHPFSQHLSTASRWVLGFLLFQLLSFITISEDKHRCGSGWMLWSHAVPKGQLPPDPWSGPSLLTAQLMWRILWLGSTYHSKIPVADFLSPLLFLFQHMWDHVVSLISSQSFQNPNHHSVNFTPSLFYLNCLLLSAPQTHWHSLSNLQNTAQNEGMFHWLVLFRMVNRISYP